MLWRFIAEEEPGSNQEARLRRFLPKMVKQALETMPRRIVLCGRDPANDLVLEGRRVYAGTGGGETHVLDLERDQYRTAMLKDVADLARLVDGLEHIDFYIRSVEPRTFLSKNST